MTWTELVKQNEKLLTDAAAEAIECALKYNKDFEVRLDPFGNAEARQYIDEIYVLIPDDTIVLYTAKSGYPDFIEDIGTGNDAVIPIRDAMPEEYNAVMEHLRSRYDDIDAPGTMYKNRFFETLSKMFPDSYEQYRLNSVKHAVKRIMNENDIISEMLKTAATADNEIL